MIVLDTNIVLDALVFNDPAAQPLLAALATNKFQWIATQPMRDELERVLAYPKIVVRLGLNQITAAEVLARFDAMAHLVAVSPKAMLTCSDPDDQKFIDSGVAHQATILSKDMAVLSMKKRLLGAGVIAKSAIDFVA